MKDIKKVNNYFFPEWNQNTSTVRQENVNKISNYISRVQFERIKIDIGAWRDSIKEAEMAILPYRVKMQRVYIDTILNGHITSCMEERKNLTLLKGYCIKVGDTIDEKASLILQSQWFATLLNHVFDAKFFGYSLIGLNNMVQDQFPDLEILGRWNVTPDRKQLTPFPYSPSGISFLDPNAKDQNGNSYYDWTIYVDTPSDTGSSNTGFGLLYKAAYYEILIRNNNGYNATALELFGQPTRVGKTSKKDAAEREIFFNALLEMGSNGAILMDTMDEIELHYATSQSGKNMGYANFEERCEKKISKIFFGHADAMDSIPGKLGNSGDKSEGQKALLRTEKRDVKWLEEIVNTKVLPKLANLGLAIPPGGKFVILNDKEEQEEKSKKDDRNTKIVDQVKTLKDAGFDVDEKWVEEETGIPVTKAKEPEPIIPGGGFGAEKGLKPEVKKALNKLYAKREG